jgi:uncharacterized protein YcbK (DUF882 family)
MGDLSTNFDSKEFFKPDIYQKIKSGNRIPAWYIDRELVNRLQIIRDHFNRPVRINSGYRDMGNNLSAGGSEYSFHLFGKAADIAVDGSSPVDVASFVRNTWGWGGLGIAKDFVHLDTRFSDYLVEWNYD